MKKIEICTHCYAADHPLFAAALAYQISSIVLHRPRCETLVSVCRLKRAEDEATADVMWWMINMGSLQSHIFTRERLGRRAIGRNVVAKSSNADYLWFADADYVFRDGCLDSVVKQFDAMPNDVVCVYPKTVMISRDHATGDRTLAMMTALSRKGKAPLLDIDPSEFVENKHRFAIGGMFIVRGDFARKYGYLDDNKKFQTPSPTMFPDTRCDIAYRKFCQQHGRIVGIDLPEVYRLRHSVSSYRDKG